MAVAEQAGDFGRRNSRGRLNAKLDEATGFIARAKKWLEERKNW